MEKIIQKCFTISLVLCFFLVSVSISFAETKQSNKDSEPLKILAIGNSFSEDSTQHLWNVFNLGGVDAIIGNAYIYSYNLDQHWLCMQKDSKSYTYRKNTTGTWKMSSKARMKTVLADEDWDIIVLQQNSAGSGLPESFAALENILKYVKENCPDAEILWNMTWAYQSNYKGNNFKYFDKNQLKMYEAIVNTVDEKILTNNLIDGVIPTGTAIQNLRTSYVGDTVTRDGYHLSKGHGRYVAALTWYSYITGKTVGEIEWVPYIDKSNYATLCKNLSVVHESVANAIKTPHKITSSKFTPEVKLFLDNGLNIEDYELLDWKYKASSYYNSQNGIICFDKTNCATKNLSRFSCSEIFTKEQIPVGSVIILDSGYRYRPEKWVDESYKAKSRPALVYKSFVKITDKWWENFNLCAFNFAHKNGTTALKAGDHDALRIYVPKVN